MERCDLWSDEIIAFRATTCEKRNHHVSEVLKVNNKRLNIYGFRKVSRDIILKRFIIAQCKFNQKVVRKLFYNF